MSLLAHRGVASSMPDLGSTGTSWNSPAGAAAGWSDGDDAASSRPESSHQKLQRTLATRSRGGPREQCASPPQRLRCTRGTEIIHSSMEEGLTSYKSLEPNRPKQPGTFRRYHLNHGIRVKDQDTVVVESCDRYLKTKKGLLRESTGVVTYSDTHRMKVELDVADLTRILSEGIPGGGHAWTPRKLERIFRERTGRPGVWAHYEMPFKQFLQLFPRTFEQFGNEHQFLRLRHVGKKPLVLDVSEDAMCRLGCARERGFIQPHPLVPGTIDVHNEELEELFDGSADGVGGSPKLEDLEDKLRAKTPMLPDLRDHRIKVAFKFKPHATY